MPSSRSNIILTILAAFACFEGSFYEPFMGSAAVFFNLSPQLNGSKAYISDMNQELVYAFTAVQQHKEALIVKLEEYQFLHNEEFGNDQEKRKEFYYSIRELDRQDGAGCDATACDVTAALRIAPSAGGVTN